MSLGGGLSTALNSAVTSTVAAGVTVVVAAGNDNVSLDPFLCSISGLRIQNLLTLHPGKRSQHVARFHP